VLHHYSAPASQFSAIESADGVLSQCPTVLQTQRLQGRFAGRGGASSASKMHHSHERFVRQEVIRDNIESSSSSKLVISHRRSLNRQVHSFGRLKPTIGVLIMLY
jgi:hypothetical protein